MSALCRSFTAPQQVVPSVSLPDKKESEMSMSPDGDWPAQPALLPRLRNSYVSSSLTLLSIIQGVAFAALGATVAAHAARLAPAQWLMVVVTFGALIVVWTQVSIDTMTWVLVPDFQLTLVPFTAGALELLLAGAITVNMSLWFFGATVLIAFSSVGIMQTARRARQEPENAELLARLRGMRRSGHVYNLAGIGLFVLLGMASLAGWFSIVPTLAAPVAGALAGLWEVGWLLRSATYWRKIVAFARMGK
jgi:hypothetical protein